MSTFDGNRTLKIFEGPNRIVRRAELSRLIGIPEGTLRNLMSGDGPPFVRLGPRSIGYELAAVELWIEARNDQRVAS